MGRQLKIGDPVHFRWLKGIIAAVFILSVVDGLMTLVWVLTGLAKEANPMMDYLINLHPAVFMAVKIALVGLGITLLYRLRRSPLAIVGIFLVFIAYYTIVVSLHLNTAGILIAMAQK